MERRERSAQQHDSPHQQVAPLLSAAEDEPGTRLAERFGLQHPRDHLDPGCSTLKSWAEKSCANGARLLFPLLVVRLSETTMPQVPRGGCTTVTTAP